MNTTVHLQLPLPEPISADPPAPEEGPADARLLSFCDEQAPLGDAEAAARQRAALRRLHGLFRACYDAPFLVFVSGSYRLGVATADADIDVVFVVANQAQVFDAFAKALSEAPGVQDLQAVPNARVPLIGLELDGQELDVMVASLRVPDLPTRASMLASYEWMNGLDEASVLAFNGPRVTELLLRSVPRAPPFLVALRLLRFWARRRCVYSNKSGFFGGVNLAILLAYVAQRFPRAGAARLLRAFFALFAQWAWSSRRPVRLDEALAQTCPVWLAPFEWKPHGRDKMVVLTPCFPRFNSMYSASGHSCRVMAYELRRAHWVLDRDLGAWDLLCAPLGALVTCPRFIRVSLRCAEDSPEARLWQGFMESQVRYLVEYLSQQELAVEEFRYVPRWTTRRDAAHARIRESFITAEDDGKIRTYTIRGSLEVPRRYFMDTHAAVGPRQPPGSDVSLDFVRADAVPDDVLRDATRLDMQRAAALEPDRATLAKLFVASEPAVADAAAAPVVRTAAPRDVPRRYVVDLCRRAGASPPTPTQTPLQGPPHRRMAVELKPAAAGAAEAAPATEPRVVALRRYEGRVVQGCDVYIGPERRDGGWSLPQSELWPRQPRDAFDSADAWLRAFREDLERRISRDSRLRKRIAGLTNQTLGCWCAPRPCHGDVVVEVWRKCRGRR